MILCSSGILLILTWSLRYSLNRRDNKIKGVGVEIRRLDTHCTQSGGWGFHGKPFRFLNVFDFVFFYVFYVLMFSNRLFAESKFRMDEQRWWNLVRRTYRAYRMKNLFCTIFDARFLMIPVQVFYKDSSLAISVSGKGMLTWYALLITPVNVHSETDILIHFRWNCYIVD